MMSVVGVSQWTNEWGRALTRYWYLIHRTIISANIHHHHFDFPSTVWRIWMNLLSSFFCSFSSSLPSRVRWAARDSTVVAIVRVPVCIYIRACVCVWLFTLASECRHSRECVRAHVKVQWIQCPSVRTTTWNGNRLERFSLRPSLSLFSFHVWLWRWTSNSLRLLSCRRFALGRLANFLLSRLSIPRYCVWRLLSLCNDGCFMRAWPSNWDMFRFKPVFRILCFLSSHSDRAHALERSFRIVPHCLHCYRMQSILIPRE